MHDEIEAEERLLPDQPAARATLVMDLDHTLACTRWENGRLIVHGRPGVTDFLQSMAKLYELVLWTGSMQAYADAVVEAIGADKFLSHRLYMQHLQMGGGKDLSKLGRDLARLVMVDDDMDYFPDEALHDNVLFISPYYGEQNDDQLAFMSGLLRQLAYVEDTRKEIRYLKRDESRLEGVSSVQQTITAMSSAPKYRQKND